MPAYTGHISVNSKGKNDIIDLTKDVNEIITESGVKNGIVTVFVPGSTASITTIEYETGLKKDIPNFLEKIAPYNDKYHHHATWNDDNGSSHIQAAFLGPSCTIPLVNGAMTLGTWQQIVLIDSDTRSRKRELVVQLVY